MMMFYMLNTDFSKFLDSICLNSKAGQYVNGVI